MANKTLLSYGANSETKISQFWVLLTLAGIIGSAGVADDSVATVIGAMIVAPLMTPILGSALALVFANHRQVLYCLFTVIGGALLVISLAYLFGLLEPLKALTEGNSQVSSRVNPRLIDLIAALATGSVGAFALVRSDISDTLPGVAIAISLVPPLAVVGLTLQDGKTDQALGALLLFVTNVAAIIFTVTMGLLLYRVRATAIDAGYAVGQLRGFSLIVVVTMVAAVAIPLAYSTQKLVRENWLKHQTAPVVAAWADDSGWSVVTLEIQSGDMKITAQGPPPEIDPESLREALDAAGYTNLDLSVELIVGGTRQLLGTGHNAELQ